MTQETVIQSTGVTNSTVQSSGCQNNTGLGFMLLGSFALGVSAAMTSVGLWLKYNKKYKVVLME